MAAIEIYNKPGFPYRTESFAILAINGWELLLKAKWLADNRNQASSLYVYETRENADGTKSKKKYVKRTDAGNPFTHGLCYLAKKLVEDKKLDALAWDNIQILLGLRDSAVHFYNQSPAFRVRLQEIGTACTKNFASTVHDWFDRQLSEFELHLMPLAFVDLPTNMDGFLLNAEEKNFLSFLENMDKSHADPESAYSVTVNIEFRYTRSKAKEALLVQNTNDPNAPAVRLTEEHVLERYPWDYSTLTEKCKERYQGFKANQYYHNIRRPLQADRRYGITRYLDPANLESSKKAFFSPNIFVELDNHFRKKATTKG
nr:DUF3644 domain-containing protein [Dehalogenimonas alkenigignens]